MELIASVANLDNVARIIEAYKKNMKPIEKSSEEIKYEQIKIKPLPESCGCNVNILI